MEYCFLQLDVQRPARSELLGITQVALDQPGLRFEQSEMGECERDQDCYPCAGQQNTGN
jgi:hypothetical protein